MELSRLYTNLHEKLPPLNFKDGLNIVRADIKQPTEKKKSSHNLGKSTLVRVIDFCLLSGKSPDLFLFKIKDVFDDFVFFLEIKLGENDYVTIRRSVANATKISLKRHLEGGVNLVDFTEWDQIDIPFDTAKGLLDGYLDWRIIKPWQFRQVLSYFLRSQRDYDDVFQLTKHKGGAVDWKPLLAQMLGFDGNLVKEYYQKEIDYTTKFKSEKELLRGTEYSTDELSKVDGMLSIKADELKSKKDFVDNFEFFEKDKSVISHIVDDLNQKIADLNDENYNYQYNVEKIETSLKGDKILFNPDEASKLFAEAGVIFEGQIKKDFTQLVAFNRAISKERNGYLNAELIDLKQKINSNNSELSRLGAERSINLAYLKDTDIFVKYKAYSRELTALEVEVANLTRAKMDISELQIIKDGVRQAKAELIELETKVANNITLVSGSDTGYFRLINKYFNEIVMEVFDTRALITVSQNKHGHLDFKAEYISSNKSATGQGEGSSYKRILCVAFDLAVLRAHIGMNFPTFVYHDGVFEGLDPRKKTNLLNVYRKYNKLGIQSIVTMLSSELSDIDFNDVNASDVILNLHEDGKTGRLFKMNSW